MNAARQKADQENRGVIPLHPTVPALVVEREVEAQLQDLNRMREVGMAFIERLDRRGAGLLRFDEQAAFEKSGDICVGFARVSRAVRQIMVLEQEIFGLRQPPGFRAVNANNFNAAVSAQPSQGDGQEIESDGEHTDLNDLNDYDNGPRDAVMARVKEDLGFVAPAGSVVEDRVDARSVAQSATNCVTQNASLRDAGYGHDGKSEDVDHRIKSGDDVKSKKSALKAALLNGAAFHNRGPPA